MKRTTRQWPFSKTQRPKYGSVKCHFMGEKFDSMREMKRYIFLLGEQKEGRITNLRRQVRFVLFPDEYKEVVKQLKTKAKIERKRSYIGITYNADFVYEHNGQTIVEDVKINPRLIPKEYVLKEKMMHYIHGIDIRRVYEPTEKIEQC